MSKRCQRKEKKIKSSSRGSASSNNNNSGSSNIKKRKLFPNSLPYPTEYILNSQESRETLGSDSSIERRSLMRKQRESERENKRYFTSFPGTCPTEMHLPICAHNQSYN